MILETPKYKEILLQNIEKWQQELTEYFVIPSHVHMISL